MSTILYSCMQYFTVFRNWRVYKLDIACLMRCSTWPAAVRWVSVRVCGWLLTALMYLNYSHSNKYLGQDNKARQSKAQVAAAERMRNWDSAPARWMLVAKRRWSWGCSSVGTWSWDRMSTHQMHVKVPHWESQCPLFIIFFCSCSQLFGLFPEKTSHQFDAVLFIFFFIFIYFFGLWLRYALSAGPNPQPFLVVF